MEREFWFEPKTHGYGAGLPVHRKGWIVLGLYGAGLLLSGLLFLAALPAAFGLLEPRAPGTGWTMPPGPSVLFPALWLLLAVLPLTAWLTIVARARTRGGWRWRWGARADGEPDPGRAARRRADRRNRGRKSHAGE